MKRVTVTDLLSMKQRSEKIACLTAYDATFARLLEHAGVEVILIGDSLGMVVQGHENTIPVRLEDMIYHSAAVARGAQRALLVTDMPFMSYASPHQAWGNAARLVSEGGAQIVKLEGGGWLAETVNQLTVRGIAVCGHLGLTPQSVNTLGGFRVQGRCVADAERLYNDALTLEAAGAKMLVLECVPRKLAATISTTLNIPVIGIGAGIQCDGQVLVMHDALGLKGNAPRFVRNFMNSQSSIADALASYVAAVKAGDFPAAAHGFD